MLLRESANASRQNIIRQNPELEEIYDIVSRMFGEGESPKAN
jgi:hypothetical protein